MTHEFEHREKSFLVMEKQILAVLDPNKSNSLSKSNQFQLDNFLKQLKLTESLMEAFRFLVIEKIAFSRRDLYILRAIS